MHRAVHGWKQKVPGYVDGLNSPHARTLKKRRKKRKGSRFARFSNKNLPHTIHAWYIYLHLVDSLVVNVSKYTLPYKDGMGSDF